MQAEAEPHTCLQYSRHRLSESLSSHCLTEKSLLRLADTARQLATHALRTLSHHTELSNTTALQWAMLTPR
jgi:hypothetical protein